jgi:hypothetical protein
MPNQSLLSVSVVDCPGWPEPLISINPDFERGAFVSDRVRKRRCTRTSRGRFALTDGSSRFAATRNRRSQRPRRLSFVTTSCTGSGKSLSFWCRSAIRAHATNAPGHRRLTDE